MEVITLMLMSLATSLIKKIIYLNDLDDRLFWWANVITEGNKPPRNAYDRSNEPLY